MNARVNMDTVFRVRVTLQPDHLAIITRRLTLTYGELDQAVEGIAARLRTHGVHSASTVGLHLPSGLDYITHAYAIWRVGACVVPIAPEQTETEKQEILDSIAMDFIVADVEPLAWCDRMESGPANVVSDSGLLIKVRSKLVHPEPFGNVNAAFIRFTSGTTGQSKGVVLSHETVFERISAANVALRLGPDDTVMWLLSMSYHFTVSIVGYLSFGATIVLPRNTLAAAVLDSCVRHDVTFLYGSPMHCALLAAYPGDHELSTMRYVVSTTAAMSEGIGMRFYDRFGVPVSQALGIIEVGLPCINLSHAAVKPGSVGRPLPAYEIRLEDAAYGDKLKEIAFKGPGFLDAYYSPWRPRDLILNDGWFPTHDVGEMDEDGCLFVRARSKDVISVMGMKFFPQEVERVLARDSRVRECAVFAVPHERMGHVARARVVLSESPTLTIASELIELCRKHVAPYKLPEAIEFVDALPRTASGKVLHRA